MTQVTHTAKSARDRPSSVIRTTVRPPVARADEPETTATVMRP